MVFLEILFCGIVCASAIIVNRDSLFTLVEIPYWYGSVVIGNELLMQTKGL